MCKIVLSGVNQGVTIIQNRFLDEYLCDASEHELKVYLYLLRYVYSTEADISITAIADALDYKPAKVKKALDKWKQEGLISYRLNSAGEIDKIILEDIHAKATKRKEAEEEFVEEEEVKPEPKANKPARKKVPVLIPEYSAEQINVFASDDMFKRILVNIEEKVGKPLSQTDFKTIAVIYESFGFSEDLIYYLYDHCIECGKTNASYVEKVAVNWAENGIKTVYEAKGEADNHNGFYARVKGALGKRKDLTSEEKKTVDEWISSDNIPEELVIEACERAGQNDEVKTGAIKGYVNKILMEWKDAGFKTLSDVKKADEDHRQKNTRATKSTKTNSQITDFPQRSISKQDADDLERKLMNRDYSEEKLKMLKEKIGIS